MTTNLDKITETAEETVTEILFERVLKENRPGPLTTEQLKDIYHLLSTIGMFQYSMKDPLKISEMKPELVTAFHALKKIGVADSTGYGDQIAFLTPFGKELDFSFKRDGVYERRTK